MKFIRFVVTAVLTAGALAVLPTPAHADSSGLFWTNTTEHSLSSGTFGGTVTAGTLADVGITPEGLATDGAYLYWANVGGIGRTPITGGTSQPMFVPAPGAMNVAVNANAIYFTQGSKVMKAPIAGGTAVEIIDAGAPTNAITVDDTYVYWTTTLNIGRAKLSGADADAAFISVFTTGGGLVATNDSLYFTGSSPGGIGKVSNTRGATPDDFWLDLHLNPVDAGMTTDGTYLYWADSCVTSCGSVEYRGRIGAIKLDGSEENRDFITGLGDVYGLAALTRSSQTITFAQPVDTGIQFGPITLSATASSGLEVSFKSNDTTVCTVAGSVVTFAKAGTCSITASQAGNASYAAAPEVTKTFAIQPLPGALATICAANGSCAGKDISNADLTNANLSGVDFTGAVILSTANFTGANLTGANFTNAVMDNVTFKNANFTSAILTGIQTNNTVFYGTTFNSTTITNANFKNSDFTSAKFIGATVLGSVFFKCKLPFSLFVDTKLFRSGVQLRTKSRATTFVGANLKGANFSGADARQVNFSKANLTKAKFTKADVRKANFKKATLKGTKFKGAKTKGAQGLKK